jgi:predicted PhzF superfamily epimerase YddE/YHI9
VELNFPATPDEAVRPPDNLDEALGVVPVYVGKSVHDYLVEVESEGALRDLRPDLGLLKTLDVRGTMVTSRSDSPAYDFVSRFFAPRAGIDEDPVTGSAHCCLGPYWSRRLGKKEFVAYQASERGGTVRVRLAGDRAILGGRAVTILRGFLADP